MSKPAASTDTASSSRKVHEEQSSSSEDFPTRSKPKSKSAASAKRVIQSDSSDSDSANDSGDAPPPAKKKKRASATRVDPTTTEAGKALIQAMLNYTRPDGAVDKQMSLVEFYSEALQLLKPSTELLCVRVRVDCADGRSTPPVSLTAYIEISTGRSGPVAHAFDLSADTGKIFLAAFKEKHGVEDVLWGAPLGFLCLSEKIPAAISGVAMASHALEPITPLLPYEPSARRAVSKILLVVPFLEGSDLMLDELELNIKVRRLLKLNLTAQNIKKLAYVYLGTTADDLAKQGTTIGFDIMLVPSNLIYSGDALADTAFDDEDYSEDIVEVARSRAYLSAKSGFAKLGAGAYDGMVFLGYPSPLQTLTTLATELGLGKYSKVDGDVFIAFALRSVASWGRIMLKPGQRSLLALAARLPRAHHAHQPAPARGRRRQGVRRFR